MIRFPKCLNILIDGAEVLNDRHRPKALPLDSKCKGRDQYESVVYLLLEQLSMRRTGWAVFHAIYEASLRGGKEVRITPFLPVLGPLEDHVTIEYLPNNPDRFEPPYRTRKRNVLTRKCRLAAEQDNPDGALLHELVHAMRQVLGQLKHAPSAESGYGDEEEFFATLITNIYLSESGTSHLPANLLTSELPDCFLDGPESFLGTGSSWVTRRQLTNRRLVSKLINENRSFCENICQRVTAEFNPVRDYMQNTPLYPFESK